MLLHVRVIGSALKHDIESNFEAMLRSLGHKMPKVFKSTRNERMYGRPESSPQFEWT